MRQCANSWESMRKCVKSSESMTKCSKSWQSVTKLEKVWEIVSKAEKEWESVLKAEKVYICFGAQYKYFWLSKKNAKSTNLTELLSFWHAVQSFWSSVCSTNILEHSTNICCLFQEGRVEEKSFDGLHAAVTNVYF